MTDEILMLMQEECAEVIQVISKIRRFGIEDIHPDTGVSNRAALIMELGDLQCLVNLLVESDYISQDDIDTAAEDKLIRLEKWSNLF